jgi:hypothetical protein
MFETTYEPKSRKMRALKQAAGKGLEAVAQEAAASPLSYVDIARDWTLLVRRTFPELDLRYTKDDVYELFRECGVQRRRRPA